MRSFESRPRATSAARQRGHVSRHNNKIFNEDDIIGDNAATLSRVSLFLFPSLSLSLSLRLPSDWQPSKQQVTSPHRPARARLLPARSLPPAPSHSPPPIPFLTKTLTLSKSPAQIPPKFRPHGNTCHIPPHTSNLPPSPPKTPPRLPQSARPSREHFLAHKGRNRFTEPWR